MYVADHPSLAGENIEGWIYPLDDFPLDIHPVHPGGKYLVIPEQARSLDTGATLSSDANAVRATVTVLSDEEAEEQEQVSSKARELLLELEQERKLKRKTKNNKWCCLFEKTVFKV